MTFAHRPRARRRSASASWLVWARADGVQFGRRRLEDTDAGKVAAIVAARANGTGVRRIACELGAGVGTVLRLIDEGAATG
jgi:hypothetical protein